MSIHGSHARSFERNGKESFALKKRRSKKKPLVAQLGELKPTACPCGSSRRAFLVPGNKAASVHLVEISRDAERHYHRRLTEIYVVLEGRGRLELDGRSVPLRPGTAVLIPPLVVHRARGRLKILNISVPPFDPADEHICSSRGRKTSPTRKDTQRPDHSAVEHSECPIHGRADYKTRHKRVAVLVACQEGGPNAGRTTKMGPKRGT